MSTNTPQMQEDADPFSIDHPDAPYKNQRNMGIPETAYIQFDNAILADYLTINDDHQHHTSGNMRAPLCDFDYNNHCGSAVSSMNSSPSLSTVSSPLSTPTRFMSNLQQFTQKSKNKFLGLDGCVKEHSVPTADEAPLPQQEQHHDQLRHHHNHHHHHSHQRKHPGGGCCLKAKKNHGNERVEMSPYRQLLPIMMCLLTFILVSTVLMVCMDSTEIHHQQFRLNMTRDYSWYNVTQDNPVLIAFLRLVHLKKYPKQLFEHTKESSLSATNLQHSNDDIITLMAVHMDALLNGKRNGAIIESSTGALGHTMTSQWFVEALNWDGIVVEPEPRKYFMLRAQHLNHTGMNIVHACLSPNTYPKEITIHNHEAEMSMSSLLGIDTNWFNSRVKCFPLYSLMLAFNRVEYDVLSLGVPGEELQILQTLPFDKIKIELITVHLLENHEDAVEYIQLITMFLREHSYVMKKQFGLNYIYQRTDRNVTHVVPEVQPVNELLQRI